MKHLDLFSGIGGFALAARWMGWETIQFVEIDKFCQKVLNKNFPNIPIHDDIKTFDGSKYRGTIDILTGGFPCQDLSSSGTGQGISGSRSGLWHEMLRVSIECKPSVIVIENSPNLLTKGFEKVLHPLSEEGYNVEWQCLYASDVGQPHGRERVFIVAYSNEIGRFKTGFFEGINREKHSKRSSIAANGTIDFDGRTYTKIPEDLLLDDGISYAMDFVGAFGNAIVPQVAYEILRTIRALI